MGVEPGVKVFPANPQTSVRVFDGAGCFADGFPAEERGLGYVELGQDVGQSEEVASTGWRLELAGLGQAVTFRRGHGQAVASVPQPGWVWVPSS